MPEVTCPTGYRALWSLEQGRNMCINDAGEMVEPLTAPPPGPVTEQPWGLMPGTPWKEQEGVSGEGEEDFEEEIMQYLLYGIAAEKKIETIGGYDYEVAYNTQGGVLSSTRIGVHQEKGREPWETEESLWERQYLEQQFAWQQKESRRQMQQEQEQYLAKLSAHPTSWLEYAAASGQPAAVQPWMLPLMPQQYSQLQAGAQIPGFKGTAGMTGMPELTRPSRQYQARMGPTAMGQYQGYRQARTGATPEETDFRLWSKAPPSGEFAGIRYRK